MADYYNWERPHSAHNGKTPMERYFELAAYFHERRSLNNFHRDRVITFEQIAE
ncbi:hypothetical protein ESCOCK438M_20270 [Escherichia coli]